MATIRYRKATMAESNTNNVTTLGNDTYVEDKIQIGDTVSHPAFAGIGLWVSNWDKDFVRNKVWMPYLEYSDEDIELTFMDDERGEWIDSSNPDDGEWIENPNSNWCFVIMIGDDREHLVEYDDLTKINDDDYCINCGQIGCSHG